jgi:hypothetical protein
VREYEEHPSRVAAWRDGELIALPDAEADDCTVWFGAEEHSGGQVRWEGLLARRVAEDRARICAVAFWLYDLNLGDEVSLVESAEGALVADGVVRDAGTTRFRVIFEGAADDDERWRDLMVELEPYGCWFDVRSPGFVAISAPPEHGQAVANHLAEPERRAELRYETGRTRPIDP